MRVSLIVARSQNGVIGANGQIPWRLPNDLKRFKQLTMGHCLIMGRKTHVSIGKPLPGRTTIVLSRGGAHIPFAPWVHVAESLHHALKIAVDQEEDIEPFICGGGEVYRDALEQGLVDRVYLTVVEQHVDGDTRFDANLVDRFNRIEQTFVEGDGLSHRFEIWERK